MWNSHVIGIGLVSLGFFFFARGIVGKTKGDAFNPWPTFVLLLIAIVYQLIYPETTFWRRIPHFLTDFGAGMALSSVFLAMKRFNFKLFLVPGLLSVMIGGGIYLLGVAYDSLLTEDPVDQDNVTQLLVELGEDDHIEEAAIQTLLTRHHAIAEQAFPMVDESEDIDLSHYYVIYVPSNHAHRLLLELEADTENVDQIDVNHEIGLIEPSQGAFPDEVLAQYSTNDPYFDQQWYAQSLNYEGVYALLRAHKPAKKARVAIVDTGVDADHEDLANIYDKSGTDGDYDKHSHGTHCAGLAGAIANNNKGVGSMNWEGEFITISGYAALDDYGRGTDLRVARAIIKAAEDGADVISMSLGGPAFGGKAPKSQSDAIKYARKLGAIVVVAAGNSNQDAKGFAPANVPGVICVSAVDPNLRKASFSNTNTSLKMPIASPGVNILSSVPRSQYQSYNGTSMATPIVAGLVGIMRALKPSITLEETYEILVNTGAKGEDAERIGRLIQPVAVVEAVLAAK